MTRTAGSGTWRAVAAALALLVTGAAIGIAVDRHLIMAPGAEAAPLTAEALAERLHLSSTEATHVRELLDSLHTELMTTVGRHPDSLWSAARRAQERLEAALPERSHAAFHGWIREHHERLMSGVHHRH